MTTRRQIITGGAAFLGGIGLLGATRIAEAASIGASPDDYTLVATIGVSKRDRRTFAEGMSDLLDKGASVNKRGLLLVAPGMYGPPPKLPFVDIVSMAGARKTVIQADQKLSPVSLYSPVSDSLLRDFTLRLNITGGATGGAVIDARGNAANWAIEDVVVEVVNGGGAGKAHLMSLGGSNSGSIKGLIAGDISRAEQFSMGDKYAGVSGPWAGTLEMLDCRLDTPAGIWGLALFDAATYGTILWENVRVIQDGSGAPIVALWHSGAGGAVTIRNSVMRGLNPPPRAPNGGGLVIASNPHRLIASVENSFIDSIAAGQKGMIVLYGCSYTTLVRGPKGILVDLGTHAHPYHMRVVQKTWETTLPFFHSNGGSIVRSSGNNTVLAVSGDILGAYAGRSKPDDAEGAFPSTFNAARCPRYVQDVAFTNIPSNTRAFFGLRAQPKLSTLPAMTERHAGIVFDGQSLIGSSSDGNGVGQTSHIAQFTGETYPGRWLKLEIVIYGDAKVTFKVMSNFGEGDDYGYHSNPSGIPNGDLGYQELFVTAVAGDSTKQRITLGEGFVEEHTVSHSGV